MTHIENIRHIMQHGITHHSSANRNPDYKPIGDNSLINSRSNRELSDGRKLGDFIPFYFGYRTPMLYVIWRGYNGVALTKQDDIVYIVSNVQKIIDLQLEFVFTDGHAVDAYTSFYNKTNIEEMSNIIDFNAVKAKYWIDENDLDKKRKKEAEFLIADVIPYSAVLGYIVYNTKAQEELERMNTEKKIVIRPDYYF